jgi:hypothetical protein
MTIQRTSEAGGFFSLSFEAFIEVWLQKATSPTTLVTTLGPYAIALENVAWRWQAAASSLCQHCADDFSVLVERSPFLLRGYGTTPTSDIHLDESVLSLPLRPICSAQITSIQQTSWAAVKELMR